jgi:hypothetical protein
MNTTSLALTDTASTSLREQQLGMGTYGSNSTDSSFLINFSILRCVSAAFLGFKGKTVERAYT